MYLMSSSEIRELIGFYIDIGKIQLKHPCHARRQIQAQLVNQLTISHSSVECLTIPSCRLKDQFNQIYDTVTLASGRGSHIAVGWSATDRKREAECGRAVRSRYNHNFCTTQIHMNKTISIMSQSTYTTKIVFNFNIFFQIITIIICMTIMIKKESMIL